MKLPFGTGLGSSAPCSQKSVAIRAMRILGLDAAIVSEFERDGKVYMFENGVAKEIEEDSEVYCKIRALEKERGMLVYAVTHERFGFGECFSFLDVSKYEEDWAWEISMFLVGIYAVHSYVWNVTHPECSGSGRVLIQVCEYGIERVG